MRLPIQSWSNTLRRFGKKVVRKPREKLRRRCLVESLEARQLLAADLYRIYVGSMTEGEATFSHSETDRSVDSSTWFEASSWQSAVYQAVSQLEVEVDGSTTYSWTANPTRFKVGTIGDLNGISGFSLSLGDDTKVIVFEDNVDEDYDDVYWKVSVEQKPGDEPEDDDCGCAECGGAGVGAGGGSNTSSESGTSYSSLVNPHPIIRVHAVLPLEEMTAPDLIEAQLTYGSVVSDTVYYDPTGYEPGDELVFSLQVDASALPTGRYDWELELTHHYGMTPVVRTYDGEHDLVNRAGSEFGKGWYLDELDRLVIDGDDVLLVTGDNKAIWFEEDGGDYVPEAGGYSSSTLEKNIDDTYTLTMADGSRLEFDEDGLLTERVDQHGNERAYAYDDEDGDLVADELVEIEDHVGRTTTFTYTGGLVTSMEDFAGAVTTYAYTSGRLTSITAPDPDGAGGQAAPVTEYEYNATTGLLETVVDALDNETNIVYDHARRVSSLELADGGATALESFYSQAVVDLTTIGYDDTHLAPVLAVSDLQEYSEDADGNSSQVVRDHFGRPLKETDAAGVVTRYERDLNGRVTKMIEEDPDGVGPMLRRVTTYAYDSQGNMTQRVNPDGSEESWTYDATFSQVTSYTDPLERVTWYDIDSETGDVLSMTQIVGEDDRTSMETDDITTTYTYTDGTGIPPAGLLETETDPLGRVTVYTYNSLGLVETITYADGTADESTITYEYDARDNVEAMIDGLGRRTEYGYDNLDRLIEQTDPDPDGGGPLGSPVWQYTYDANGNRTHVTDPLGNVTEYVFDERDRVEQMIEADPDGGGALESPITQYQYDYNGNLLSITDPLNRVTTYEYDDLDRLVKVTEPDPDGAGALESPETNYVYDKLGRLRAVIDPVGVGTFYEYDIMDRQTAVLQTTTESGLAGSYYEVTDPDGIELEVFNGTSVLDLADSENQSLLHTRVDSTLNFAEASYFAGFTDMTGYVSAAWEGAIYIAEPGEVEFFVNSKSGGWLFVDGELVVDDNTTEAMAEVSGTVELVAGWHFLQIVFYNTGGNSGLIVSYDPVDGNKQVIPAGVLNQVAVMSATEYDAAGQVIATTDALGRTTGYGYDDLGRLVTTTLPDPDGAGGQSAPVYETEYDDAGNVISETDALGNVTSYEYDNLNRRIQVTQPDPDGGGALASPVWEYEYDDASQLVSSTDPLARVTGYEYDDLGRQIAVTQPDPDGVGPQSAPVWETSYDAVGNVLSQTDPLGNETSYEYDNLYRQILVTQPDPDGGGAQTSPEWEYEYDDAGQLISMTDPLGHVTSYEFDNLGRQIKVIQPDPDGAGSAIAPEFETEYDAVGRVISETDALGKVTSYEYDVLGRMVKLTQPDPDGAGGQAAPVIEYEYDLAGQMVSMTDAMDRVTTYEYDGLGRQTKVTQPDPDGGGAQLAPWTVYTFDAVGNMLTMTDRLGNETSYEYDNLYRQTSSTNPNDETTEFGYDAVGNRTSLADPELNTTTWVYDGLNRVIEETNQFNGTRWYKYDAVGNLTRKIDRNGKITRLEYDNLHRQTAEVWQEETVGDKVKSRYVFYDNYQGLDPDDAIAIDAAGAPKEAVLPGESDVASVRGFINGLIIDIVDVGSISASDFEFQTSPTDDPTNWSTYSPTIQINVRPGEGKDGSDRIEITGLGVLDQWLQVTILANEDTNLATPDVFYFGTKPGDADGDGDVDGADFVAWQTHFYTASGGTWDIGDFSGDGDVDGDDFTIWQTNYPFTPIALDASATVARTINYEYDALGRLLEVTDRDGANDPASADYVYTYDNLNRVYSVAQTLVGLTPVVTLYHGYDDMSRRITQLALIGGTADFYNNYAYDALGRMTLVRQSYLIGNVVADKRADFTYNAAGQFDTITRYADWSGTQLAAESAYGYDGAGRLTSLAHEQDTTTFAGYEWTWDAAGRITGFTNSEHSGEDATYDYDDAGQLTAADYDSLTDEAYTYDDNGNRIDVDNDAGSVTYATGTNNQLDSDGVYDYEYDGEGNRVLRTNISTGDYTVYEWDHRNRLVSVSDYDDTDDLLQRVEYTYDALNRRIAKDIDADGDEIFDEGKRFVYDEDHIALVFDEASSLTNRYLHGPVVDMILADESVTSLNTAGDVLWPLTDHLGTVRDLAEYDSGTGNTTIANHIVYDSFGNVLSETNSSVDHAFGFTGRERDKETGLNYHRLRYLDVATGRWISEDPIEFDGGDPNLQRYVQNAPTLLSDPTGAVGIEGPRYVAINAPSINPTRQTNLSGARWNWIWENGDLPALAQRVTVEGWFSFNDDCGFSHRVDWRENYVEVWTQGGTRLDNHQTRPKKPAEYLEEQLGFRFQERTGNKLFAIFKNEEREVEGWSFFMQAKFEIVNGFYPNWNARLGGFYTSKNDFEIVKLVTNNVKSIAPGPSKVFNSMLYPGPTGAVVPGFPPPQTRGNTLTANDQWQVQWTQGETKPRINYTTTSYR